MQKFLFLINYTLLFLLFLLFLIFYIKVNVQFFVQKNHFFCFKDKYT